MNVEQKLDLILEKVVRLEPLIEKVDILDKKVDSLEKKVDSLDKKVDSLDKKVDSLDIRMEAVEGRLTSVEGRLISVEDRLTSVEDMQGAVKGRLLSVELTIENDIKRNIQTIAEGHSILNRKLDEVLIMVKNKEQIEVRVNVLEDEVRKLKAAN